MISLAFALAVFNSLLIAAAFIMIAMAVGQSRAALRRVEVLERAASKPTPPPEDPAAREARSAMIREETILRILRNAAAIRDAELARRERASPLPDEGSDEGLRH